MQIRSHLFVIKGRWKVGAGVAQVSIILFLLIASNLFFYFYFRTCPHPHPLPARAMQQLSASLAELRYLRAERVSQEGVLESFENTFLESTLLTTEHGLVENKYPQVLLWSMFMILMLLV